jgi:hypothetical protein
MFTSIRDGRIETEIRAPCPNDFPFQMLRAAMCDARVLALEAVRCQENSARAANRTMLSHDMVMMVADRAIDDFVCHVIYSSLKP